MQSEWVNFVLATVIGGLQVCAPTAEDMSIEHPCGKTVSYSHAQCVGAKASRELSISDIAWELVTMNFHV